MSTDTYTLEVDADEAALVMEYRARKNAPPKPRAQPKRRLDRVALLASLALVCVMLVLAGFRVADGAGFFA